MRRPKSPVVEAIESEVNLMAGDYGYEVVDIKLGGPKRNPVLTVLIDKPGGVTADDCAQMSKRFGLLLDAIDPIPTSYQLAVSSPGVERPLTKTEDFRRFVGRNAAIRLVDEQARAKTVEGELRGIDDGRVLLQIDGAEVPIPEDEIESAHLTFDWDPSAYGIKRDDV
jgi:ribosome maturation factor RimP